MAIRNFGNLDDIQTSLADFTVIIGRNKIGKTTFLEALRFVEQLVRFNMPRVVNWKKALRLLDATLEEKVRFQIDFYLASPSEPTFSGDYSYVVQLTPEGFHEESISALGGQIIKLPGAPSPPFFLVKRDRTTLSYRIFKKEGARTTISPELHNKKVSRPDLSCTTLLWDEDREPYMTKVRNFLITVGGYEPDIVVKTVPVFRTADDPEHFFRYERGPGYLSLLLHQMKIQHPHAFQQLEDYMRILYPDFVEFVVPEGKYAEIVKIKEKKRGKDLLVPDYFISDGTKKIINALAKGLCAPLTGRPVVLIDEIENSLHPSLVWKILEILTQLDAQFIVTTHSPLVLSSLPEGEIRVLIEQKGSVQMLPGTSKAEIAKNLDISLEEVDYYRIWTTGDDSELLLRP